MSQPLMPKNLKLKGSVMTYKTLEVTPPKDILFITGDWDEKVGSQDIPVVIGLKFGLWVEDEAGQRLTEFCRENALVRANILFQQHKEKNLHMNISRWSVLKLIIFFVLKDGEALYSQQKTRVRVDGGSDHELLIAKFRLKLKKAGKTTRPFRYGLNQIPYNNTVEVTNRFKRLGLIDRVPEELWTKQFITLYRR